MADRSDLGLPDPPSETAGRPRGAPPPHMPSPDERARVSAMSAETLAKLRAEAGARPPRQSAPTKPRHLGPDDLEKARRAAGVLHHFNPCADGHDPVEMPDGRTTCGVCGVFIGMAEPEAAHG